MAGIDFATQGRTAQGMLNIPQLNNNLATNFDLLNTLSLGKFSPSITSIGSNAGNLGVNQALNTAGDAVKNGGEATKGLNWFGNNGVIGSTASLIGSGVGIWNAYNSYKFGKDQVEQMKRQNTLLENQYNEEVKRYNKREAERDASNSYFQNMAGNIWEKYYSNYGNANANNANANTANDTAQNAAQMSEPQEKKLSPVERE